MESSVIWPLLLNKPDQHCTWLNIVHLYIEWKVQSFGKALPGNEILD